MILAAVLITFILIGLGVFFYINYQSKDKVLTKEQGVSRNHVYTDRLIYEPGNTVVIQGMPYIGFNGRFKVSNTEIVPLEVFDSQGARVFHTNIEQNDYGTFSAEFDLPDDAPLGTYRIDVFGQSFYFDVQNLS